jgi:hypothetical protein
MEGGEHLMHPAMIEALGRERRQDLAKARSASPRRPRRPRRAMPAREAAGWLLVRAGLSLVVR